MAYTTEFSLFDGHGQRKYLNQEERQKFYSCAGQFPLEARLFCLMVYFTGARISEIANLGVSRIDFSNKTVIIQTLKRRKKGVFRQVPLPDPLLEELRSYIGTLKAHPYYDENRLWYFSTRTASRHIKAVMHMAEIKGHKASARGLRHGFAVQAVMMVPITQVQLWLGHAHLQTTTIYVQVSGTEERAMAEKLWASG
ncbi:MAG: site-specific integrase [Lewinellaceae bacterium]|nr:site-specific integrase [Saprospiraceae bacterium]MCB9338468.1 site-specific integrase [Lewinellaceae bacterium]